MFSCEYSKSFRNSFFIEQLLWLLLKKEVSGEIAFELISLFHVQIQEPTSRSTTMRAIVFLAKFAECYYDKILQTKIDDNISICVDKHSSCGFSITGDIKIYQCHMIKR